MKNLSISYGRLAASNSAGSQESYKVMEVPGVWAIGNISRQQVGEHFSRWRLMWRKKKKSVLFLKT